MAVSGKALTPTSPQRFRALRLSSHLLQTLGCHRLLHWLKYSSFVHKWYLHLAAASLPEHWDQVLESSKKQPLLLVVDSSGSNTLAAKNIVCSFTFEFIWLRLSDSSGCSEFFEEVTKPFPPSTPPLQRCTQPVNKSPLHLLCSKQTRLSYLGFLLQNICSSPWTAF